MKKIGVCAAKTRLSALLAEVERGEQFVITRRGVAVARLVPEAPAAARRSRLSVQRQRVAEAFNELRRLRAGTVLDLPLQRTIAQGRD